MTKFLDVRRESVGKSSWIRLRASLSTDTAAPPMILLLTWTGAFEEHITKYEEMYQAIFPSSHTMVIRTSWLDMTFRSSYRKQRNLQPEVQRIHRMLETADAGGPGILMHVLSDGGSNKAGELAEAYLKSKERRLPVSAMVLDSTPGSPDFARYCLALEISFQRHIKWRPLAKVTAKTILSIVWPLYHLIVGYENNPTSKARSMLADGRLFDQMIPRSFLYSRADRIVPYGEIEAHAKTLEKGTVKMTMVCFEDTEHVRHMKDHAEEYRRTVEETWTYHKEQSINQDDDLYHETSNGSGTALQKALRYLKEARSLRSLLLKSRRENSDMSHV